MLPVFLLLAFLLFPTLAGASPAHSDIQAWLA